jgi:hypothetical protein
MYGHTYGTFDFMIGCSVYAALVLLVSEYFYDPSAGFKIIIL